MEQINMRKYTMRKSSAALLAVLLAGCLVACGKKTTNTDAGMEAISAQNYEQARTCFDKAILEGEDLQLAAVDPGGRRVAHITVLYGADRL